MGTYKIKKREKKKAISASQHSNLISAAQGIDAIAKQVRSFAADILAEPSALQIDAALKRPTGKVMTLLGKVIELFTGATQTPDLPPAWLYALMSQSFAVSNDIAEGMGTEVLACKKGCSWCCSLEVRLSAPEVLAITDYLRHSLPAEDLHGLRARLAELAPRVRQASSATRQRLRITCPLLVDKQCSVYLVRPLACRGWNSFDATACEISYNRFHQGDVPFSVTLRDFIIAIREGLCQGAQDAGLQGDKLELISALHVALETPDIEEKWLTGERVFG